MTTDADKMAAILAELTKSRAVQRAHWNEVVEYARAYAMIKLHGRYIEGGSVVHINHADKKGYVDHFQYKLLESVERAFMEDAMMGAAIGDAT